MNPVADLFIAGTDTGVGKSVVSLLLLNLLFRKGYAPFYLKPFQTGCVDAYAADSDAGFVHAHAPALKGRDPAGSVIYCHPEAKAPYFAALKAGDKIDLAVVQSVVEEKRKQYSPLVIEGAGGLLVPATRDLMMVDVIKALGCRPILVSRAGLGTINHTLLSIEAMRRRQIEPLGVVLMDGGMSPADDELVTENIAAIEMFAGVNVGGRIGRLSDFSNPPASAYEALENVLTPVMQ